MGEYNFPKTLLENINKQNEKINECIEIVNQYTISTEKIQELDGQLKNMEEKFNNHIINHPSGVGGSLNKIEVLEEDPIGDELYEGRIWITTQENLTTPVILLNSTTINSIIIYLKTQSTNYGEDITTYEIYKDNNLYGNATLQKGETYEITGLLANTSYNIKVRGKTSKSISDFSNILQVTTKNSESDIAGEFASEINGVTNILTPDCFNGASFDNNNKCYTFNGDAKYITLPCSDIENELSIEMLINDRNNGNTVVAEAIPYTQLETISIQSGDSVLGGVGTISMRTNIKADSIHLNTNTNGKHHCIWTINKLTGKHKVFFDGVKQEKTLNNPEGVNLNATKYVIGSRQGVYGTNCDIYSFKLYNRELTDEECLNKFDSSMLK